MHCHVPYNQSQDAELNEVFGVRFRGPCGRLQVLFSVSDTRLSSTIVPSLVVSSPAMSLRVCAFVVLAVAVSAALLPPPRRSVKIPAGVDVSEPCVANITAALEKIIGAGVDLVKAIDDCNKKNDTAGCVAEISNVAAELASAAADVSGAVQACSGKGTACVTDLLKIAHDLAKASSDVSAAVSQCQNSHDIVQCVLDVIDIAGYIDQIVGGVEAAIKACGSHSTM